MAGRGRFWVEMPNTWRGWKLREYFMPRIVQPEDEDGIARPDRLMGSGSSGQGFVPGKKVKSWKVSPSDFPNLLTWETEQLLKEAVNLLQNMESGVYRTRGRRPRQLWQRMTIPCNSFKSCGGLQRIRQSTNNLPVGNTERPSPLGPVRTGTERHANRGGIDKFSSGVVGGRAPWLDEIVLGG